ncbi:MAG TPA: cysteine desulfurase [Rectinemataceae bacterium]|nr:cysteine desulfurase [Rectinemataceae bacterium]
MDSIVAGGGLKASRPSVERIRADFPLLSRNIEGKPLVYLDNAATSQKPRAVIDAVSRYYSFENANVHRAIHRLGEEATSAYERARERIRSFLNAGSSTEIVFTRGTTESINLVASTWGRSKLGSGDVILISGMEHHSDIVPWQLLRAERGVVLKYIPVEEDGSIDLARMEESWDARTRLVCVTQTSNVLGTINDVAAIAGIAHGRGAALLVDGAQSTPHMPVDLRQLDCDFFAFSAHKVYGPMGIGVLYGREEILETMPPWMGGGDMIRSVGLQESTWNDLPWKFEAGTPNVEGAIGLAAALDYVESLGFERIEALESALTTKALDALGSVEGLHLHGRAGRRGPVFSFTLDGIHAHDLAQFLDREGIAVRAGHHCAQPLMRALGVPATVRASFAFYNTVREIELLVRAIEGARRFYT